MNKRNLFALAVASALNTSHIAQALGHCAARQGPDVLCHVAEVAA
ncbi:hypothetical protein PQQ52_30295 [Paraburkholderia sediminicola]